MWVREYTKIYQNVRVEDVWKVLTDVNHWPTWHSDLEDCVMEGEFKVGNHFMLTPKGMGPVKITLIDVKPNHSFTDLTKFFGAVMMDTHEIVQEGPHVRLKNTLVVKGPLRYLWIKLVAQHVADSIPEEMDALIKRTKEVMT